SQSSVLHPLLPSFPTRRSSDLDQRPDQLDADQMGPRVNRFQFTFLYVSEQIVLLFVRARSPDFRSHRNRFPPEPRVSAPPAPLRSEEHTSELQSRENLVCRLLL